MGKVSNLILEIQDMLVSGLDADQIARRLDIPESWVYDAAKMMQEDYGDPGYNDSMDGDFDSAMASAGFGTDEDYGYCPEDF